MWLEDLLHQKVSDSKILVFRETEMRQSFSSLAYSCWRIVRGGLSPPSLTTLVTGFYPVDESICHYGNRAHVMTELQIVRLQVSLDSLFLLSVTVRFRVTIVSLVIEKKVGCYRERSKINLIRGERVVCCLREWGFSLWKQAGYSWESLFLLNSCVCVSCAECQPTVPCAAVVDTRGNSGRTDEWIGGREWFWPSLRFIGTVISYL